MLEIQANQSAELRRAIFAERLVEMFKAGVREVVVKDAKANPTRLGFDNQGFIGSITSPLGRTWNLDNNPDGKLLGIRNPAGLHLGFDYNEEGDITRIARNDTIKSNWRASPPVEAYPNTTNTTQTAISPPSPMATAIAPNSITAFGIVPIRRVTPMAAQKATNTTRTVCCNA